MTPVCSEWTVAKNSFYQVKITLQHSLNARAFFYEVLRESTALFLLKTLRAFFFLAIKKTFLALLTCNSRSA